MADPPSTPRPPTYTYALRRGRRSPPITRQALYQKMRAAGHPHDVVLQVLHEADRRALAQRPS